MVKVEVVRWEVVEFELAVVFYGPRESHVEYMCRCLTQQRFIFPIHLKV